MIISHRYKYIFLKPEKVAGTSLELALAESCGQEDLIARIANLDLEFDDKFYAQPERNNPGFHEHACPAAVISYLGDELWHSYTKIAAARNPWDLVVSRWHWQRKLKEDLRMVSPASDAAKAAIFFRNGFSIDGLVRLIAKRLNSYMAFRAIKQGDFDSFVRHYPENWTNNIFYFDNEGKPIYDILLRFESLQQDYSTLCARLGMKEGLLPRAKSKVRMDKRHYSDYYTEETREIIAGKFRRQIEHFGYSFEKNKPVN